MTEKSKHTPGPWNVMSARTLHHVETDANNARGAGIAICSLPKSRFADARLIAAAPDLLAACEAAPVIRIGESFDDFAERYKRWHREVRVPAVRKAKGET